MPIVSDKRGHGKEQDRSREVESIHGGTHDTRKSIQPPVMTAVCPKRHKGVPDGQGQGEEGGTGAAVERAGRLSRK